MNRKTISNPHVWASALRRAWLALKRLRPSRPTVSPVTKDRSPVSSKLCELMFCFLSNQKREALVGDLAEEYRNRQIASGRLRATLWLCCQIPTSQCQLRRRYPLFKGVLARLKPIVANMKTQIKTRIQGLQLARQYRMASSHAVIPVLAVMLLAAFTFHLWKPATRQQQEMVREDSLREWLPEPNSPSPHSEPYSKPDPESSKVTLPREISALSRHPKNRLPRPKPSPDYVAVSLIPLLIPRGDTQIENKMETENKIRLIIIPKHIRLVRFSLTLPEGSDPGRYTVKLIRDGVPDTLFTLPLNSRDGKVVVLSAPSKIFLEGTYKLDMLGDDNLLINYKFSVTKRRAFGREDEGETPATGEPTSPK